MLHIHLYRARRRHQALAEAIDEETRRLAPNAERLAYLKRRKLIARDDIAALERAMDAPAPQPA